MHTVNLNQREKFANYGFALIWPLGGLIKSLIDFREPIAKNLFWIFCVFYGLVHIYNPEGGSNADSVRYAEGFETMYRTSQTFGEVIDSVYDEDGGSTDYYVVLVTYALSRFTGNTHILFMVFALVFGFFYSRNIWFLINHIRGKFNFVVTILILSFALIVPIWSINGVRMWTAMQVFIYGFLPYLYNRNFSKIWWCILSVFFHFSFVPIVILTLIYLFLPKKNLIFFIIYIVTLFIHELDLESVREKLLDLGFGGSIDGKIISYTSEQYAEELEELKEQTSFIVTFTNNVNYYIYQLFLILSFILLRKKKNNNKLNIFFCWTCTAFAFGNLVSLIPTAGRFLLLAYFFSIVLFIRIYQTYSSYLFNQLSKYLCVILIIPIVFSIRIGMDFWGISLLVTDFFTCWFIDDRMPIFQFISDHM